MMVPVYDAMGRNVAMSKVPENFPPQLVSAGILRRKTGRCFSIWKNLQAVLEDSEPKDNSGKSK